MESVLRVCVECQEKPAAPKRKICWNCKIKRHDKAHPESRIKTNKRRTDNYKTNHNNRRTNRLQQAAKYRQGREAKAAAYAREWRKHNPQKVRLNNALRHLLYAEHDSLRKQQWALANPERVRHSNRMRKARMRQAKIGILSPRLWRERLAEYNYCCAYCLQPLALVTMDHMMPVIQGGLHDIANVVPACGTCNSSKSKKNLLEWLLYKADMARLAQQLHFAGIDNIVEPGVDRDAKWQYSGYMAACSNGTTGELQDAVCASHNVQLTLF